MNEKIFITDTHLGLSKSSDLWHNVTLDLFAEVRDYCSKNNINTIIHLGDFFHDRKVLNTKTQEVAHLIVRMFKGLNFYIIVGNHDTYYKNVLYPTSLEFLKTYPWIKIVDEVINVDDLTLCPWGKIPQEQGEYCCGHFELRGFHMNNSYICEHGQDPSILKGFKHVYSGHFHTPSTQGNITYLGSAFPQTFHDVNSPRGFYSFKEGVLNFHEYKNSPKFIKCNSDNFESFDIKNNIVKITFTKDYGSIENQKILDKIYSMEPLKIDQDFEQIVSNNDMEMEASISELPEHKDIIQDFIEKTNKLSPNIKKKVLIQMIYKLMEEI